MTRFEILIAALALCCASTALAQPTGSVDLTAVAFPDGLRVGGSTWTAVEPHRQGLLTIDGQVVVDADAPRPLDALGQTTLLAPFWHAPDCPLGVEASAAPGWLSVAWVGAAGCDGVDFELSIERRRASGEVEGGVRVTFTYRALPSSGRPTPRAGLVVGRTVLELLPDGGHTPPDRAKALLDGSSDGEAGMWVVELDGEGRVVGDADLDGVREADNCGRHFNPLQENNDNDRAGDVCDDNDDNDHVRDVLDNCPLTPNDDQRDGDGDGVGDVCEDEDGDGVYDLDDLCPSVFDPAQLDLDGDGRGDDCDPDIDGDDPEWFVRKPARRDLCPYFAEAIWRDGDGDGLGDGCDRCPAHRCEGFACMFQLDSDGDGWIDIEDLRPTVPDLRLASGGRAWSACGPLPSHRPVLAPGGPR